MLVAYQILLMVIVVLFGLFAIGVPDDDKMKDRCAKICGLGIVSLLVTFWLL